MRRFLVAAVLLVGCAPPAPPPFAFWPPLGRDEQPYTGMPWYLQPDRGSWAEARQRIESEPAAAYSERQPVVGGRDLPTGERMARLRALLAAVDAHTYAVADRPGVADVQALELTIDELSRLLAPYPDIEYEVGELRELARIIPSTPRAYLPKLRLRIGQLTDLIRVQLVAGT
jgi:hypothetical protein